MKRTSFVVLCLALVANCMAKMENEFSLQLQTRDEFSCEQSESDCTKCLQQEFCVWCGGREGKSSCISRDICPLNFQQSSCPERPMSLDEELEKLLEEKTPVFLDVPQVTVNASYLCRLKQNCYDCTAMGFCAWCENKRECAAYSGSLTTSRSCGAGDSWSRNKCVREGPQVSKHPAIPCPKRALSCNDCLVDNNCYWCESSKYCGYYHGDGVAPKNCTSDDWYHGKCSKVKAIVVVVPILLIIATPVIAYLVMYCIFCMMKEAGYDVLDDTDSSDEEEERKKKPIMLRHDSFGGKADQLRKKYNLDKKP